ncbi:MAG TPA: polysaccharide deacetylase family protein [Smithellaceae bacterium]|nr:polysaccharide deacetylase family protein [Smithellaceae bacterium]
MTSFKTFQFIFFFSALLGQNPAYASDVERIQPAYEPVPILLYHRFGPTRADGMTVTDAVFASHIEYLKTSGYRVISLRKVVDAMLRKEPIPARSVAIVVDDGHRSVYTSMWPVVRKYGIPVTLFIYPSAISNASYAMNWDQLRELQKTGLYDIQSHTYWHPNFKKEKKRLNTAEYEKFVKMQLTGSREKLEKELGTKIDMLAWPFGIYDDELTVKAKEAGYIAAFTIDGERRKNWGNPMKLPRYLLTDADRGKKFAMIFMGRTLAAAGGIGK